MSTLTLADVEKIANLARLELTEEEKVKYQKQLSAVLTYVEHLNELELEDVPPTIHAVAQQNILRDDVVTFNLPPAEALANSAKQAQNQFAIQAVFE